MLTFLTLLVVPVVYSLVEGAREIVSRRFRREPEEALASAEPVRA